MDSFVENWLSAHEVRSWTRPFGQCPAGLEYQDLSTQVEKFLSPVTLEKVGG